MAEISESESDTEPCSETERKSGATKQETVLKNRNEEIKIKNKPSKTQHMETKNCKDGVTGAEDSENSSGAGNEKENEKKKLSVVHKEMKKKRTVPGSKLGIGQETLIDPLAAFGDILARLRYVFRLSLVLVTLESRLGSNKGNNCLGVTLGSQLPAAMQLRAVTSKKTICGEAFCVTPNQKIGSKSFVNMVPTDTEFVV